MLNMNYNYWSYPHFIPKMYSSYSQNGGRFVNKNRYNHNNVHLNQSSSGQSPNKNNYQNKNTFQKNISVNTQSKRALNSIQPSTFENISKSDINSNVIFEIFGIKLHYDDILLICLIFFLYNEGIQDEFLFISLILLLLS